MSDDNDFESGGATCCLAVDLWTTCARLLKEGWKASVADHLPPVPGFVLLRYEHRVPGRGGSLR